MMSRAKIMVDPRFASRLHGGLLVLWGACIPLSIMTGWIRSVAFVAAASIYANMVSHWAAMQAARGELRQQLEEDEEV